MLFPKLRGACAPYERVWAGSSLIISVRKVLTLTWWQLSVAASGKYKAGYPLRKRSDLHKVVVISKAPSLHNLKPNIHSIDQLFPNQHSLPAPAALCHTPLQVSLPRLNTPNITFAP